LGHHLCAVKYLAVNGSACHSTGICAGFTNPAAAIDDGVFNRLPEMTAMTNEWSAFCSAYTVPEFANVLIRAKLSFTR